MAFDAIKIVDIIQVMENYISTVRPSEEIRKDLDISYEIKGQSVILNEVRPAWRIPVKILVLGYAKATFIRSRNIWKIYWKRADRKWHSYPPAESVGTLQDFLRIVDKDAHGCFHG